MVKIVKLVHTYFFLVKLVTSDEFINDNSVGAMLNKEKYFASKIVNVVFTSFLFVLSQLQMQL